MFLLIAGVVATDTRGENPEDGNGYWPQFCGPTRNLISPDTGLLNKWPPEGPPLIWKVDGLGHGFSAISVSDGLIFTQGYFGEEEKVIALAEDVGTQVWAAVASPVVDVQFPGSRSTPTVDGDYLYVETVGGIVACLEKRTGREIWSRDLIKDFQGTRNSFGYCESVLVDGDKIICTPGGKDAALVALDKESGDTVWKSPVPPFGYEGANQASYASPILAAPGGVSQYIQFLYGGVVGVRASDGVFLWSESSSANRGTNISTPVYHDGHVFSASSYGIGGALVRLVSNANTTSVQLVYHTLQMKSHHGGFLYWDGYIYGTDESILTCLNFLTGEVAWEERSVGKGSVVFAEGHVYLRGEGGGVALFEATPEGYREKGRFDQPHRSQTHAWAYPVVTGGRLYLRDQDVLLCYNLRAQPK